MTIEIWDTPAGESHFYKMWKQSQSRTFRFVRHHQVQDYLDLGWHIACADLGHHSDYSVLLEWLCSCKLKEPTHVMDRR